MARLEGNRPGRLESCSARSVENRGKTSSQEVFMLLAIAVVLLIAWALGFLAFHIAGGLIHLLIAIAVIALIVHLLRRPGVA